MTASMTILGGVTLSVCLCAVGAGCDGTAKADSHETTEKPTTVTAEASPAAAPPPAAVVTKPMTPLLFSFVSDMAKVGGVQEDGALVCRKGSCKSGIVAFGPYTKAVPEGQRVATFQLAGAGVSSLVKETATLDVYDSLGNKRLAVRSVKGNELVDQERQDIEVAFIAPEKSNLEFRVGWHGEGELKLYRVEVR